MKALRKGLWIAGAAVFCLLVGAAAWLWWPMLVQLSGLAKKTPQVSAPPKPTVSAPPQPAGNIKVFDPEASSRELSRTAQTRRDAAQTSSSSKPVEQARKAPRATGLFGAQPPSPVSPLRKPGRRSSVRRSLAPSKDAEVTRALQGPPPKSQEHPSELRSETELFRLALLQQQTRDDQSALETYRKLLALNPQNAMAFNNMGVILKEKDQLTEAADLLRKALDIDPNYDKAHTNLGVVLQLQDQPQAAIGSHMRALEINEKSWESAVNLGLLFWSQGDIERAKPFFSKALSVRYEASVLHYLGAIHEQQGERLEAIYHYRQALKKGDGLTPQLREKIQFRLQELLARDKTQGPDMKDSGRPR